MNFGIGQQLSAATIFKKKLAHTNVVPSTTTLVCASFCIFLNLLCHFSTRFLKNHSGMLYFPSRLYNRVCIFSTFYRGCTTALVCLIQPRLNVFFLLVWYEIVHYFFLDGYIMEIYFFISLIKLKNEFTFLF